MRRRRFSFLEQVGAAYAAIVFSIVGIDIADKPVEKPIPSTTAKRDIGAVPGGSPRDIRPPSSGSEADRRG